MEHRQFDTLTRLVAAGSASRRGALRLVLGSALGALAVRLGLEEAAAACERDSECPGRKLVCCDRKCSNTDSNDDHCGRCGNKCKGNEKCCDGRCKDVEKDERNCGQCGRRCDGGETCCDGGCRHLRRDEKNCGRCGKKCGKDERCRNGKCRGTCISAGNTCPLNGSDPCCEDSFCKDLGGTGLCCLPDGATCIDDFECCSDDCDAEPGVEGECVPA